MNWARLKAKVSGPLTLHARPFRFGGVAAMRRVHFANQERVLGCLAVAMQGVSLDDWRSNWLVVNHFKRLRDSGNEGIPPGILVEQEAGEEPLFSLAFRVEIVDSILVRLVQPGWWGAVAACGGLRRLRPANRPGRGHE